MEHIIWSFLASSILFFMYKTDVFVSYVALFRLDKPFKLKEYYKHLELFSDDTYWEFLHFERNNFLTKLVSCPICISFWLNLGCYSVYQNLPALIVNVWLTLFLYFVLCVMLGKSNE